MISICLLVSGGLGLKVLKQLYASENKLEAVFTNKGSDEIISFCNKNDIAVFVGNPRNGKAAMFMESFECDIVLSVNYLFIIESDLINKTKKYAINIHGSLLPKYRGRTPHVWAIINGETETGITAHLIDEKLDNGDIIEQITIPIKDNDTGGKILEKFNTRYPTLVNSILDKVKSNSLTFIPQDHNLATYFGKRTPADGKINWQWNSERIYNWIRAQAKPYPGAFTFFEKEKLVVHKSVLSDYGFKDKQANGEVLFIGQDKIIVKTSNKAICLSEIETKIPKDLKVGSVLS